MVRNAAAPFIYGFSSQTREEHRVFVDLATSNAMHTYTEEREACLVKTKALHERTYMHAGM